MSFTCGVCGEMHEGVLMNVVHQRPPSYFTVPEGQRGERIRAGEDGMIIDNTIFVVRGVLYVPVNDAGESFGWGVWAMVEEPVYSEILDSWDIDASGKVLDGILDGHIKGYADAVDIPIEIRLGEEGQRPRFVVKDRDSELGIAQTEGISMQRVHEIQHLYFGDD